MVFECDVYFISGNINFQFACRTAEFNSLKSAASKIDRYTFKAIMSLDWLTDCFRSINFIPNWKANGADTAINQIAKG